MYIVLAMSSLPGLATSEVTVESFPPVKVMGRSIFNVWHFDSLWAAAVPQSLLFRTLAVPTRKGCLLPALPEDVLTSIVNFAAPLAWFFQVDRTPFPNTQRPTMVILTGEYPETREFFEDIFLCSPHPIRESSSFVKTLELAAENREMILKRCIVRPNLTVISFMTDTSP